MPQQSQRTSIQSDEYRSDFFQFANQRAAQKAKFGGEFFPSTTHADAQGRTFIQFFQVEKSTRHPKGKVLIDLSSDPILQPQVTP